MVDFFLYNKVLWVIFILYNLVIDNVKFSLSIKNIIEKVFFIKCIEN